MKNLAYALQFPPQIRREPRFRRFYPLCIIVFQLLVSIFVLWKKKSNQLIIGVWRK